MKHKFRLETFDIGDKVFIGGFCRAKKILAFGRSMVFLESKNGSETIAPISSIVRLAKGDKCD